MTNLNSTPNNEVQTYESIVTEHLCDVSPLAYVKHLNSAVSLITEEKDNLNSDEIDTLFTLSVMQSAFIKAAEEQREEDANLLYLCDQKLDKVNKDIADKDSLLELQTKNMEIQKQTNQMQSDLIEKLENELAALKAGSEQKISFTENN